MPFILSPSAWRILFPVPCSRNFARSAKPLKSIFLHYGAAAQTPRENALRPAHANLIDRTPNEKPQTATPAVCATRFSIAALNQQEKGKENSDGQADGEGSPGAQLMAFEPNDQGSYEGTCTR